MSGAAEFLSGAPDKVALIDAASGARVTYGELAARVARAARELAEEARGFGGGPAFVFAGNDVATVVHLLAGFAAGVPVALFDPRLADDAMAELRRRYRPAAIRGVRTPVEARSGPFDSGSLRSPALRANGKGGGSTSTSPFDSASLRDAALRVNGTQEPGPEPVAVRRVASGPGGPRPG